MGENHGRERLNESKMKKTLFVSRISLLISVYNRNGRKLVKNISKLQTEGWLEVINMRMDNACVYVHLKVAYS